MPQAKTLNKAELKTVLDVVRALSRYPERDVAMLMFTHYAGLRIGEVAALKVRDVVTAQYTVSDSITLHCAMTKHHMSRTVFLPKPLQQQLKHYLTTLNKPISDCLDMPLFVTQKRQAFTANTATQHLKRLYEKAGIKGATSHTGRRTWLTTLSHKGVNVRVLAALAGHRSIQTTQRYIDINDTLLKNAASMIV
jgi:integrase/recombinase XerD